jgi:hypothetical protein
MRFVLSDRLHWRALLAARKRRDQPYPYLSENDTEGLP